MVKPDCSPCVSAHRSIGFTLRLSSFTLASPQSQYKPASHEEESSSCAGQHAIKDMFVFCVHSPYQWNPKCPWTVQPWTSLYGRNEPYLSIMKSCVPWRSNCSLKRLNWLLFSISVLVIIYLCSDFVTGAIYLFLTIYKWNTAHAHDCIHCVFKIHWYLSGP